MIKHIVMWKFKESAEGKNKAANCAYVKGMLESLAGRIPELKKIEVGVNINPLPSAFDMVLYTEFATSADLETYKNHPDHVKVSDYISLIRLDRVAVDYQV